jgi:cytochrome oxidase Cu insertion factor (SCO1/SenC/PrrC family)
MLKLIAGIASLLVAATSLVVPAAPVPRTSPEFAIVSPGGRSVQLSAFKGKVVVMEFLFVKSEHCLRVLRTLGKLQGELGSRGFQPVGVVFDPPNTSIDGRRLAAAMQDYFKLTFPVGYSSKEDVDRYLGRTQQEILSIPQVIVIDRTGTIRATSGGRGGDLTLEDEGSLRNLIGKLLDESH